MVKKVFLFFSFFLFFSCDSNKKTTSTEDSLKINLNEFVLNNEILKNEIIEYINIVFNQIHVNEKVLFLNINLIENKAIYHISTNTEALYFDYKVPLGFFKYDENIIFLFFWNDNIPYFDINIKNSTKENIVKKYFPAQFLYFNENDTYPAPMTGSYPIWKLTFLGEKLIDKKTVYYIDAP